MKTTKRTIDQILAAIHALDLDPIKVKLMDTEDGEGWSRQRVDRNAREYKRFLILSAKYPDQPIAPGKDVDKFWHSHILDTIKYAEDCENLFGYFLHHFPYFGMRGAEDAGNLADTAINTARLYAQEFGQLEPIEADDCGAAAVSHCARTLTGQLSQFSQSDVLNITVSHCARALPGQLDKLYQSDVSNIEASHCARTMTGQLNQPFENDRLNIHHRPTLPSLV